MHVRELNKEQLEQLKIQYYDELLQEQEKRSISYGEIADIDEIINDEKIYHEYDGYVFSEDDFFSTQTEEESEG